MSTVISLFIAFASSCIAGFVILPRVLGLSVQLGFTDKPNFRKVHRKAIPVVGGIAIFTSTIAAVLVSGMLQSFVVQYLSLTVSLVVLAITGIMDDRLDLAASLRLAIQLTCAGAVAYSGIRIESLHGILGIHHIPVEVQYIVTIIIITGITNAFNLIDGIDGLAGIIAFVNLVVLGVVAAIVNEYPWLSLLLAVIGGIIVFLRYNWYPAHLFMGDGGSLFLGFLMSVTAIHMLQLTPHADIAPILRSTVPLVVTGCFIIPVVDTLRVMLGRMQKGKSPFAADKTHLHHKLIRHFLVHGEASRKLVTLHLTIITLSAVAYLFLGISTVLILQILTVVLYTLFLDFSHNYSRWYRFIRRYENSN